MKTRVVIVDYGLGNILSVSRAFEAIDCRVDIVTKGPNAINASLLVIPGVGAFPEAMSRLRSSMLADTVLDSARCGTRVLGICLGMQVLFARGYEHEECAGLGLIAGNVERLPSESRSESTLRLPSIGWREAKTSSEFSDDPFGDGISDKLFYFVHSYHAKTSSASSVVAWYERGGEKVVAAIRQRNIYGVQFHPEKSGRVGLELLRTLVK